MAEALKLMLTGMSTVFIILILVVLLGNIIIQLTNKYAPSPLALTENKRGKNPEIDPKKMAAIVSAVQVTTQGRGVVSSIERMK